MICLVVYKHHVSMVADSAAMIFDSGAESSPWSPPEPARLSKLAKIKLRGWLKE